MVQWLRLLAPKAGGMGSFPGQRTRSHMPHTNFAGYHQKNMYAAMKIKEPSCCSEDPMQPNKWIFLKNDLNNKFFVVHVLSQLKTKGKKKNCRELRLQPKLLALGQWREQHATLKGKQKKRVVFLMATSPLPGAAWRRDHCYGRVNQPAQSTQTLALMILSASCQLLWRNELYRQIACCCWDKANSPRGNESGLAWKRQTMNHGSQSSP